MIILLLALLTALSFSSAGAKEKESEGEIQPHPCLAAISKNSPQPVWFENLAVDVDYRPSDIYNQYLTGKVSIAVVYPRGVTQPLELRYQAMQLEGRIDSIASCHRVDSLLIYQDSSLVFFSDILPAGAVDTLVLWFTNHNDYRGSLLRTRDYHGVGAWCPVPAEIENRFTVEVTVRTPTGLVAVAGGELLGKRQVDEKTVEHRWRQKTPGDYSPAMVIDSFTVSKYERQGRQVAIYHRQRPEQLVNARADWLFDAADKFNAWFGPIPYSEINLVEWEYDQAVYFSVPGLIGAPEEHFGGKMQIYMDTSTTNLRKIQSHELAHQWWAEKVYPPENRSMMEAWAEYSALKDAGESMSIYLNQYKSGIFNTIRRSPSALSPLVEPGQDTWKFYRKGPWVLHMLENELGEQTFLAVLKAYQEQYSYQEHRLSDFFGLVASVTGRDMDWFMREWFYKSGAPSLTLRQEKLANQTILIIRQNGEIYNIPLPLEVYRSGAPEALKIEHTLTGAVDTLWLEYADVDSVLIDPGQTLLLEQVFEPVYAVAPFGDSPASRGVYDIRFYMDPAREISPVLFYKTGGNEWDSIAPAVGIDTAGYGRFRMPARNPGQKVSYYAKFTDTSGGAYFSPPGAPQTCHSFRTTSSPPGEDMVFVSFAEYQEPGTAGDLKPFRDYTQGLVGLDMNSRRVFGVLYGVGSVAPQVDPDSRLYMAYNRYSNSVDIVDLDSWEKTASCPMTPECKADEYELVLFCRSAYDPKRKNYYYYDGNLHRINVKTLKREEFKDMSKDMNQLPSIFTYNRELDRLLIKKGRVLLVLDPQNLSVLEEIKLRTDKKLPFLDGSGKVETLEYIGDAVFPSDWQSPLDFVNLRLRYTSYAARSNLTLVDSLESSIISDRSDLSSPFLKDETTVKRVKGTNIFFGTLPQNEGNRFVWDVSSGEAPFVFSDHYYIMPVAYWIDGKNGMPVGIFPSETNSALALVDLKGRKIIDNAFSPFSTGVYDYLQTPRIIGIVSPESELRLTGDVNKDGKFDIFDLIRLLSRLNDSLVYSAEYDLNNDRKVDVFDLLALLRLLK